MHMPVIFSLSITPKKDRALLFFYAENNIMCIIIGGINMTIIFIYKMLLLPPHSLFFSFLTKLRGVPVRTGMTIFFLRRK